LISKSYFLDCITKDVKINFLAIFNLNYTNSKENYTLNYEIDKFPLFKLYFGFLKQMDAYFCYPF